MESIEQLKTASPPETNAILLVLMMGDDRGVSTMIIFWVILIYLYLTVFLYFDVLLIFSQNFV